ncbi:unnamed protein product [Bemisia tabaci]|uniref:Cuticle protein n=1 Tax=Bemisia tabaci TaxID=7038 RepID=A0A9P0F2F0_BEMTA|nr:PREDICTED: cuticle protein 16.5-like [Bemisia tabaci]CAH0386028.1 unnamed protein product [Bemisia tabaci]
MQLAVFSTLLLLACAYAAPIEDASAESKPAETSNKEKRGLYGVVGYPSVAAYHAPAVAAYHAPAVAAYHAPVVAAPAVATSYSHVSVSHPVAYHAPVAAYHAPAVAAYHAPAVAAYHAPVYAPHSVLYH